MNGDAANPKTNVLYRNARISPSLVRRRIDNLFLSISQENLICKNDGRINQVFISLTLLRGAVLQIFNTSKRLHSTVEYCTISIKLISLFKISH